MDEACVVVVVEAEGSSCGGCVVCSIGVSVEDSDADDTVDEGGALSLDAD